MLSDLIYRLRALLHRERVEDELQEELQYHLEREAEKYRKTGDSPEEAMRRARLAIGGPEPVSYTHLDVYKRQGGKQVNDAPGISIGQRANQHRIHNAEDRCARAYSQSER